MAKNMSFEEFSKKFDEATLDGFIERVKELKAFPKYVESLKERENTAKDLLILMLLQGYLDPGFDIALTKISMEIFAGMLDSRFRAEMGVDKE